MRARLIEQRLLVGFVGSYYLVLLAVGAWAGSRAVPLYAGFLAVLAALVVAADRRVSFSTPLLWCLAVWGLAHMIGGLVPVDDRVPYQLFVLPVLRFDQVVHAFGFGVAGVACLQALRAVLTPRQIHGRIAGVVVLVGGTSLGAINEVIEFLITRVVPETNIGGYENTGWDLVANLAGALLAAAWVGTRRDKPVAHSGPETVP